MKVSIYTDGAARGNPDGPGGYGVVLEYVDPKGELHVKELSGGYVRTTNNRMELMAVIRGLEALNSCLLYTSMRLFMTRTRKRAMLTRGTAGIRGKSLIVNLPGSPKIIKECLEYVLPEIVYATETAVGEHDDVEE